MLAYSIAFSEEHPGIGYITRIQSVSLVGRVIRVPTKPEFFFRGKLPKLSLKETTSKVSKWQIGRHTPHASKPVVQSL